MTILEVIIYLLAISSLCHVVYHAYSILKILLLQLLPCQNLKKKYKVNESDWVVVTGGTDGIGKGYCQYFAENGFNICIISRSQQKIMRVIQELKVINKNNQYKSIVADFTKCHKNEHFWEEIENELKKINVAILVNNVGISYNGYFQQQGISSIHDVINVNCFPMAILSSVVAKQMLKSYQKSKVGAIINLSSYSCVNPTPYFSLYAGTKGFNHVFSRCISQQFKDRIDVMSILSMKVQSQGMKEDLSFAVVTARSFAQYSLKCVGYYQTIYGHINHEMIAALVNILPQWLVRIIAIKETKKSFQFLQKRKD